MKKFQIMLSMILILNQYIIPVKDSQTIQYAKVDESFIIKDNYKTYCTLQIYKKLEQGLRNEGLVFIQPQEDKLRKDLHNLLSNHSQINHDHEMQNYQTQQLAVFKKRQELTLLQNETLKKIRVKNQEYDNHVNLCDEILKQSEKEISDLKEKLDNFRNIIYTQNELQDSRLQELSNKLVPCIERCHNISKDKHEYLKNIIHNIPTQAHAFLFQHRNSIFDKNFTENQFKWHVVAYKTTIQGNMRSYDSAIKLEQDKIAQLELLFNKEHLQVYNRCLNKAVEKGQEYTQFILNNNFKK